MQSSVSWMKFPSRFEDPAPPALSPGRVLAADAHEPDEKSAWKRLLARFESGILVRVTNLGLGFVFLTLVVAMGATNTGNNGLYILVALLLAILVVSGIVSRWNVEGLVPDLECPDEIFAGTPARFQVRIHNSGKRTRKAILVRFSSDPQPLLFPEVVPGEDEKRGLDLVFSKRGLRHAGPLLVYSGYPIGLFRKGHIHSRGFTYLVFPKVTSRPLPRPEPSSREGDAVHRILRGRGTDIRNLREASPGDDPRDIHWPQTARQGTLIVKERSAEQGRDAMVFVESPIAGGAAFERAVSEAAGVVLQLLGRGDRVGLAAPGHHIPPAAGPAQRKLLLTALSLSEAEKPIPRHSLAPGTLLFRISAGAEKTA